MDGRSYGLPGCLCAAVSVAFASFAVFVAGLAAAEIEPEPLNRNTELPTPGPHSVWYLDMNPGDLSVSRYVRLDADDMSLDGILGTGSFPTFHRSPDGEQLYVTESWLRGPHRVREDFVTIYDAQTLRIEHVIELPGARRSMMAPIYRSALTADGGLLVIFNFTPSTSLTVVDLASRHVVGTTPTPGCSLVHPTAKRGVSMICGDGTLLTLHFGDSGEVIARHRSDPFFDPDVDPIIENGARLGDVWYFTSYGGDVYPVDLGSEKPAFGEPWALIDHSKKPAGWLATLFSMGKAGPWRPGGFQLATANAAHRRLFVLTHPVAWSQGEGDHVFPGPEVWVYDVDARERVDRIKLRSVGLSIYVTDDEAPLLLVSAVDIETEEFMLEVYDAETGRFLREMEEPGTGMFHYYDATSASDAEERAK